MDGRAVFLGLAFALMWSSAFTSARIIVAYAPPLYSLSARFLISGLIGGDYCADIGAELEAKQKAMDICRCLWGLPKCAIPWLEFRRYANGRGLFGGDHCVHHAVDCCVCRLDYL